MKSFKSQICNHFHLLSHGKYIFPCPLQELRSLPHRDRAPPERFKSVSGRRCEGRPKKGNAGNRSVQSSCTGRMWGGDTPASPSGRGCRYTDMTATESESNQRVRRDSVGATGWGRRTPRGSKSEAEISVGSLLEPPWAPSCLRRARTRMARSSRHARAASECSPEDLMKVTCECISLMFPPLPVPPQQRTVSCSLHMLLSSVVVWLLLHLGCAERKFKHRFSSLTPPPPAGFTLLAGLLRENRWN